VISRQYRPHLDKPKVSQFLASICASVDRKSNWLRARWEYMIYSVQSGLEHDLTPIGIWEVGEEMVAMVNLEDTLGEVYFQVHPAYDHLKREMLSYAEGALCKVEDGKRRLTLYVSEFDHELEEIAAAAGYLKAEDDPQVTSEFDIAAHPLTYSLPDGYRMTDRVESNDLRRINRVLWRGFSHEGPPPEKHVAGRADVEKAPLYRADSVVMVEAPDRNFASYCGIWYEAAIQLAYVEPVATDPDCRRKGLGKAAVLEGIKRAKELGATRAIVGSGLEFYRAIGFRRMFAYYPWQKEW
jgi:GNAT superfamily N-acetyltransferase